jgi:aspartyl-tRNA(Asn)/glutamyl-tRNA(Gln) amidotransferase subunit C
VEQAPQNIFYRGTDLNPSAEPPAQVPADWRGNMANVISDETIEYVGILAKLELSDEEKEAAKKDMASMLDHIDKLNELDTTGVEPMSHVFPVENVMREDVVTNGDGSEATLANAPERKEDAFVVPKTVD